MMEREKKMQRKLIDVTKEIKEKRKTEKQK